MKLLAVWLILSFLPNAATPAQEKMRRTANANRVAAATNVALSFKAHHGRFGAWSSFTFGQWWSGGGIVQRTSRRPVPSQLPIYVAGRNFNRGGGETVMLPFVANLPSNWIAYAPAQVKRNYKLATDEWRTPDFSFRVRTPFERFASLETSPDELRRHLAPVEVVEIEQDNLANKHEAQLVIGFGADVTKVESTGARQAIYGDGWMLATNDSPGRVQVGRSPNIAAAWNRNAAIKDEGAGASAAFSLRVPAGERATFKFVLAHYTTETVLDNKQNNEKPFRFFYTKLFDSLESIADYGLANADELCRMADAADRRLENSKLNFARRFIIAHGVRSYLGNTGLLTDGERTLFVEFEGEYQFVNTLDLVADHCFFTAEMFPWALKNQLDWYADKYSYRDNVKRYGANPQYTGGVSFTHDMGVPSVGLTPYGTSQYERTDIDPHKNPPGTHSFMTVEELCNWTLAAFVYWQRTKDDAYLRKRQALLNDLVTSFVNRDAAARDRKDDAQYDGLPSLDSAKTGAGAEITTYDSLAPDLAIAVDSSYIAVKAWASQVALWRMLSVIAADEATKERVGIARRQAGLAARSLQKRFDGKLFPARFVADNQGVALPTVEGVAYLMNDAETMRNPAWRALLANFKTHAAQAWTRNRQPHGVALTSGDTQIWLSKLAINEAVLERLDSSFAFALDDARHAANFYTNGADEPYGDNWDAATGQRRQNVRNYPRGAAAWIWMNTLAKRF